MATTTQSTSRASRRCHGEGSRHPIRNQEDDEEWTPAFPLDVVRRAVDRGSAGSPSWSLGACLYLGAVVEYLAAEILHSAVLARPPSQGHIPWVQPSPTNPGQSQESTVQHASSSVFLEEVSHGKIQDETSEKTHEETREEILDETPHKSREQTEDGTRDEPPMDIHEGTYEGTREDLDEEIQGRPVLSQMTQVELHSAHMSQVLPDSYHSPRAPPVLSQTSQEPPEEFQITQVHSDLFQISQVLPVSSQISQVLPASSQMSQDPHSSRISQSFPVLSQIHQAQSAGFQIPQSISDFSQTSQKHTDSNKEFQLLNASPKIPEEPLVKRFRNLPDMPHGSQTSAEETLQSPTSQPQSLLSGSDLKQSTSPDGHILAPGSMTSPFQTRQVGGGEPPTPYPFFGNSRTDNVTADVIPRIEVSDLVRGLLDDAEMLLLLRQVYGDDFLRPIPAAREGLSWTRVFRDRCLELLQWLALRLSRLLPPVNASS